MEKLITANADLVAKCGLYCGACNTYLNGKCNGCSENIKAEKWCKVKKCCSENSYENCGDCKIKSDPTQCKDLNNFISKVFSLLFRSDRNACIKRIKEVGAEQYANEMTESKQMTIKQGK